MSVLPLVLSIIALCVSVAALVWQMVAHSLTGVRVKVEPAIAWLLVKELDLDFPELSVTVSNTGRLSVNVTRLSVEIGDNRHAALTERRRNNPTFPHRLDVGA